VSITEKVWHITIGSSWVGSLTPTGADGDWYTAEFTEGDAWGNFAPWFRQAYAAYTAGDEATWRNMALQFQIMGLAISADDGESYANPAILIDGSSAWFAV
jgi:hypothetical protein